MTPPLPHAWKAPVVEDMVWYGKSGLTEAVVTGPGRAILFYGWQGWQSLGEGLSLGEAWDAAFTLLGSISWVGIQAQLSTILVSLSEGWWLITQAITEGCIKPRGPGHPHSIPPVSTTFNFSSQDPSPQPASLPTAAAQWEVPRHGPDSVPGMRLGATARLRPRLGATRVMGNPTPSPSPHQIMDLRVFKAQHQLLHQCHWGLRDQEVPGICAMTNSPTRNPEAIWRSTCQSSGMRTQMMPSHTKVGIGVSLCWVLGLHPSPLCYLFLSRLPGGVGERFRDRHHPGWFTQHTGWAL